ncbi:MAG: transcription antitermination factor NusB [Synergistes sp.]|nr:transcription antitermination factor NusB [Synergistes sp.]
MLKKKHTRRRAREIAMQLIYMMNAREDIKPEEILQNFSFDEALVLFHGEPEDDVEEELSCESSRSSDVFDTADLTDEEKDEILSYAKEIFGGTVSEAVAIDDIICMSMDRRWRPERIAAIDKAVISMAIYEGILSKKVPVNVAISEAVAIVKKFGAEESGRFVNGVLGRISREYSENEDDQ